MNSGMGRVYDITFRDCTFTSNTGAGSGDGVNGVKIWSSGQGQHYLTFAGCTFQVLSRMGIEVCGNNSDSNPTLYNIALRNCTFEPTTLGEPITSSTWSPSGTSRPITSLVDGCTIKGFDNAANAIYGGAIECNGSHDVEIRDAQIWSGRARRPSISAARAVARAASTSKPRASISPTPARPAPPACSATSRMRPTLTTPSGRTAPSTPATPRTKSAAQSPVASAWEGAAERPAIGAT